MSWEKCDQLSHEFFLPIFSTCVLMSTLQLDVAMKKIKTNHNVIIISRLVGECAYI